MPKLKDFFFCIGDQFSFKTKVTDSFINTWLLSPTHYTEHDRLTSWTRIYFTDSQFVYTWFFLKEVRILGPPDSKFIYKVVYKMKKIFEKWSISKGSYSIDIIGLSDNEYFIKYVIMAVFRTGHSMARYNMNKTDGG